MPRITISGRRDDCGVITGRTFDRAVPRLVALSATVFLGLAAVVAGSTRAEDPFQSAPGPAATPKPTARPPLPIAPEKPVTTAPAATPPLEAAQGWEGVNGIWQVIATLTGRQLSGQVRCYRTDRGQWGGWFAEFAATLDDKGAFSSIGAVHPKAVMRRISGIFPQVRIESAEPSRNVSCPNGEVVLRKRG